LYIYIYIYIYLPPPLLLPLFTYIYIYIYIYIRESRVYSSHVSEYVGLSVCGKKTREMDVASVCVWWVVIPGLLGDDESNYGRLSNFERWMIKEKYEEDEASSMKRPGVSRTKRGPGGGSFE